MRLANSLNGIFKIVLLVILSVIAVRIWQLRRADDLFPEPTIHGIATKVELQNQQHSKKSEQQNGPHSQAEPKLIPGTSNNDIPTDEELVNLIAKASGTAIMHRIFSSNADIRTRLEATSRYFDVAAAHGDLDDFEAIFRTNLSWRKRPMQLRDAILQLVDRNGWDSIQYLLQQSHSFTSSGEQFQDVYLSLLDQTPLPEEKLSRLRVMLTDKRIVDIWNRVFAKSLEGTDEQWNWTLKDYSEACQTISEQESRLDLRKLVVQSDGRERQRSRLSQLLGVVASVDVYFVRENISLFRPEHALKLANVLQVHGHPREVLDYVLALPEDQVKNLWKDSARYRAYIQSEWKITTNKGASTGELELFLPWIREAQKDGIFDSEWACYSKLDRDRTFLHHLEWLWEKGFKPSEKADQRVVLFMAVRYGDIDLIDRALENVNYDLHKFLANGAYLHKLDGASVRSFKVCPLSEAASNGNLVAMRKLLKFVRANNHSGPSPIIAATLKNHVEAVRLLISAGFKVDQRLLDNARLQAGPEIPTLNEDTRQVLPELGNKFATEKAERAAQAGDVAALKAAISEWQGWNGLNGMASDARTGYIAPSSERNAKSIVLAAIHNADCVALLQFEGYRIDENAVARMIKLGYIESLKIALRDYETLKACSSGKVRFHELVIDNVEIRRVLEEAGLL